MANSYTKYPKAFIPDTECVLAHMPMSGNNKDILIGTSASAYESIVMGNKVSSESDFSYQRVDSVIRYRGSYEDILDSGANYVAWKNEKFGGKVFYAYITRLEYKNPNVTWIHIDIDVINTFIYDIEIGNQFVERMHTKTDEVGDNLVEENIGSGEKYRVNWNRVPFIDWDSFVTILSIRNTVNPQNEFIDGVINPLWLVVCRSQQTAMQHMIMDVLNPTVSVVGSYIIPDFLVSNVPDNSAISGQAIKKSSVLFGVDTSIQFPGNGAYEDYTPKNYKLYTSPYTELIVGNGSGDTVIYKFENFAGVPEFIIRGNLSFPVDVIAAPNNYMSKNNDVEELIGTSQYALNLGTMPQVPTQAENFVNGILTGLNTVISVVTMSGKTEVVSRAVKVGEEITRDSWETEADSKGISRYGTKEDVNYKFENQKEEVYKEGNRIDQFFKPITASNGEYLGSPLSILNQISNNAFGLYQGYYMIKASDAKQIDDYFSVFGYAINSVEKIDLFSDRRDKFNYFKTIGCMIKSNIPSDFARRIESIFNSGVRFWYDVDSFGDYSEATLAANSLH